MRVLIFNDAATSDIYTLSLHDALPVSRYPQERGRFTGLTAPSPAGPPASPPRVIPLLSLQKEKHSGQAGGR